MDRIDFPFSSSVCVGLLCCRTEVNLRFYWMRSFWLMIFFWAAEWANEWMNGTSFSIENRKYFRVTIEWSRYKQSECWEIKYRPSSISYWSDLRWQISLSPAHNGIANPERMYSIVSKTPFSHSHTQAHWYAYFECIVRSQAFVLVDIAAGNGDT